MKTSELNLRAPGRLHRLHRRTGVLAVAQVRQRQREDQEDLHSLLPRTMPLPHWPIDLQALFRIERCLI